MIFFAIANATHSTALHSDLVALRRLLDSRSGNTPIMAVCASTGGYACDPLSNSLTMAPIYSSNDLPKLSTADISRLFENSIANDQTVCWGVYRSAILVSNSQDALRTVLRSQLDHTQIAAKLCSSLPFELYNRSIWDGIELLPPGCRLRINAGGSSVSVLQVNLDTAVLDTTDAEAAAALDNAIRHAITDAVPHDAPTICDVSGGLDSTSLAFYLHHMGYKPALFHLRSTDEANRDYTYATRAASAMRLPLELVEYNSVAKSSFDIRFAARPSFVGETLPMWHGAESHIARLRGSIGAERTHVTGIGGDEIFAFHFAAPLALLDQKYKSTALRKLTRLGAGTGWGRLATLRFASSAPSARDELLMRLDGSIDGSVDRPINSLGWFPGFEVPPFLRQPIKESLHAQIRDYVDSCELQNHRDKFRHVSLDAVWRQVEFIRLTNLSFGGPGRLLVAPFLGRAVVTQFLRTHPKHFCNNSFKPLLRNAANTVAPDWLFDRPDKGEMSVDIFKDYARHRTSIQNLLAESAAVDMGLACPVAVKELLNQPIFESSQVMLIESLLGLEKWLRELDSDRARSYS